MHTLMPLLTYDDIQVSLNIDLTDSNSQAAATTLIAAAVAHISNQVGYPIEQASQTVYFDGEFNRLWLPTKAPVSSLAVATYNTLTNTYDDISAEYVRHQGTADVLVATSLPCGFQSVRASYTTGWTDETLPEDLRQALIEIVGLKLQEFTNYSSDPTGAASSSGDSSSVPTGGLKKYTSGSYSEEYSDAESQARWKAKLSQLSRSIGDNLPDGIAAVIDLYRLGYAL